MTGRVGPRHAEARFSNFDRCFGSCVSGRFHGFQPHCPVGCVVGIPLLLNEEKFQVMPTKVEYYSLNKAANECNISPQEFRKYVGEFEKQSGTYLPKNTDGHKQIPEDFLQFFQRAVMWARTDNILPTTAMAQALGDSYQYTLRELAKAVTNTNQLLRLPGELRAVVARMEQLSARERPVKVTLADEPRIARALASIGLWQLFAGFMVGIGVGPLLARWLWG